TCNVRSGSVAGSPGAPGSRRSRQRRRSATVRSAVRWIGLLGGSLCQAAQNRIGVLVRSQPSNQVLMVTTFDLGTDTVARIACGGNTVEHVGFGVRHLR